MELSEGLKGYLAGILDGEGYVGIKRSTCGMRHRTDIKSPIFSERVHVRMTDKEVPKLFQNVFGGGFAEEGRIYQSKTGFKSNKKLFSYRASDKIAANIISILLPYLIVKRKQALLLLELRNSKNSREARIRGGKNQKRTMPIEVLNKREDLYNQIRKIHGH